MLEAALPIVRAFPESLRSVRATIFSPAAGREQSIGPAAVEEQPHRGAEPAFFLRRRFAPDQQRQHAGNADRQDGEMLRRQLGIAQFNHATVRISLRRPAILHYASWAGVLPVSQRGPLTLR